MADGRREAAARIIKFCDQWSRMKGQDPEIVHGLHLGHDDEALLRISDLRALAEFAAAPSPTETRCPECDGGWATYTSGDKAGEKVPHCDQFCSLQGAERGGDWKHGDAR